jgi:LAO/AO transport system kinase
MSTATDELITRVLAGERRAIARAISMVEDEAEGSIAIAAGLHAKVGRAKRLGITGPPGAGKSTLVQALAMELRKRGATVGVVCVDPTSPFTGGALLGDRIRMDRVATDPGVFIRSMASRGSLGGLSRKASEAADVLDASGKDWVFLETVGVGQSEIDVAKAADTTVVVVSPEAGDGVQAMKAGLMEIAEVFAVNKADREGADRLVRDIEGVLEMTMHGVWTPRVVRTVGTSGEGVPELLDAIEAHRKTLEATGELVKRRTQHASDRVRELVGDRVLAQVWGDGRAERLQELARAIAEGKVTPHAAADELLASWRATRA